MSAARAIHRSLDVNPLCAEIHFILDVARIIRCVALRDAVCSGGAGPLAATARTASMPPFARARAAQVLQALAESAGAERLGRGSWAALEAGAYTRPLSNST
jgi:hypothetical protein